MQQSDIIVEYESNAAFVAPRTWHDWDAAQLRQAFAQTDAKLDARLGWPTGSTGILLAALAAGLPRSTGWQGSAQTDAYEAALACAATVYKRGVAWRQRQHLAQPAVLVSGSYPIHFHASDSPLTQSLGDSKFVLIDGNVLRHWPDLPITSHCLAMCLTEHEKALASVALILDTWRRLGKAKVWTIVGGGLLSDVAAFAASLVDCEIKLIPTTLLAMADACVGGKTGVNQAPYGKNQIGSFYFPKSVDVWPAWLSTLTARELRAGAAECLKHAFLIGDLALAAHIAEATAQQDFTAFAPLLPQIVQVKADVVRQDPAESGRRAILNFGHTLAHALEAMAHALTDGETTILHGEAVGIGLAYALWLSHQQCNLNKAEMESMLKALRHAGLLLDSTALAGRIGVPKLNDFDVFEQLWAYALHDKKNLHADSTVEFVLLSGLGQIARGAKDAWTIPVTKREALRAWSEITAFLA